MRIIHNNNLGFHYGNRFKLGPVDSLINGMFSLGSTEMTNEANEYIARQQIRLQQEENQKNRDYNTLEAEKARQHEINMIRETPSLQVQGMHEAGINPQVALAHSTQVATGGSSGNQQASYSGGLSPVPYQAQNPASAFAQVAQGLSSLASAKEKGANVGLIEKQVENMAIDSQMKKALTDGYKLSNELQKLDLKYRDKKLLQDIQEQVVRMATTTAQGKLFTEQAKIQQSIDDLNRSMSNYHGQNADFLKLQVANYTVQLNSVLKLNAAQTRKANAQAAESSARTKTENELRGWLVGFQQAKTELAQADSFVARNTYWERLEAKVAELKSMEMLPEQVATQLALARKNNNWYEINEILGIIDSGCRVAGTYYGAKTGQGFVDAQKVRNSIDREYNAWRMSQQPKQGRTYEPKAPWVTEWH